MMMIVLRLLSLLGLKFRWHRHFSPRSPNKVFDQGGGVSVDSWTPGPKPLCRRHPTGPQPGGFLWTPATGDSTKSDFALADVALLGGDRPGALVGRQGTHLGVESVCELGAIAGQVDE